MNPEEEEVRAGLHVLADRAGAPSTDGPALARSVAARAEDRRRRQRSLLAAAGVVVLLAIAVPQLVDRPQEAAPASGQATEIPRAAGAMPPPVEFFDGAPRGSLAGDEAFLDGLRALPWTAEPPVRAADGTILYYLPDPPVDARRVVFAGDVPGGRWALVVGWTTDMPPEAADLPPDVVTNNVLAATWYTGPPGADVEQMTSVIGPQAVAGDWPVGLSDPRSGTLVVVAAPGDDVEVSRRPLVGADGRTSRDWRPVPTDDGVAVTQTLPLPRAYDGSTSYRVLRDGQIQARDMPWSLPAPELVDQPPAIDYPRGRPDALGERVAWYAVAHALNELGLPPAQTTVTAQWVGSLPSGPAGRAAVVTVTLPSGALVVSAQWSSPAGPDGSMTGAFCGLEILPAGPPAERRVQAAACDVVDSTTGAPMSTDLVVVGPPEVALIRAYDGDRVFLAEHSAQDGVLTVPLPLGTESVEAVTAGGVTLGRVDLLGRAVDFGD